MKNIEYKILIVDDKEENLQVVGNILDEKRVSLLFARNGKQAIIIAQKKQPDLILLDINMPIMDGYEACLLLKKDSGTSEIPIIFLSALNEKDNIIKAFEYGAVDYVTKPFNKAELLSRVFTHLELKSSKDQLKIQNEELQASNDEIIFVNNYLQEAKEELYVQYKHVEQAEEKQRKILDAFKDGIYINTPEYRIEYVNSALQTKLGRDPVGELCHKALYNLDDKCNWCIYEKLKAERESIEYLQKTDGKAFIVNNLLLENAHKLTTFIDVTAHKKAEAEIKQKNIILEEKTSELDQAKRELEVFNDNLQEKITLQTKELRAANIELTKIDESKSYFIGILAHELSTPIMGIEQSNNIIEMTVNNLISTFNNKENRNSDEEVTLSKLQDINIFSEILTESAARLRHIDEMSKLISQLQLGKYQLLFQEINICETIENTILEKMKLYNNNSYIQIYSCTNKEIILKIDYYSIAKVIDIVLKNAIKYSPKNSEIVIETKDDEKYYYISISDEGQGFSKQALDNLFSLFSSDDLMSHQEGIGLSLTAASIIMELNKGIIVVKNNDEKGATVTLKFEKFKG